MKNNPVLNKLKALRQEKGITQKAMAKDLGISSSMYSYIEAGKKRLTYDLAIKIASLFSMKPDDIFLSDNKDFFEKMNI